MIPSKIRICGKMFKVYVTDMFEEDAEQWGESDYEERTITIKKMEDTAAMESVLLHEVIHMTLANAGFHELLKGISETTEEAIVCALENAIAPLYEVKGTAKHAGMKRKKKVKD